MNLLITYQPKDAMELQKRLISQSGRASRALEVDLTFRMITVTDGVSLTIIEDFI